MAHFYSVFAALLLLSPQAAFACTSTSYSDIQRIQFSQFGTSQALIDVVGRDLGGRCSLSVDSTPNKISASAELCVRRDGKYAPAAAGGLRPLQSQRQIFETLVSVVTRAHALMLGATTPSPTYRDVQYTIAIEHCGATKTLSFAVDRDHPEPLTDNQARIAELYVELRRSIQSLMVMGNQLF